MIFLLYQLFFSLFAWPFLLRDLFFKNTKKKAAFKKGKQACLWLHAVSLGETKAAAPLIVLFHENWPECDIVVSCTTQTGLEEAKRQFPFAKDCFSLPFDYYSNMKALVNQIKPDLFLLCEGDFWYNLLRLIKARGATIALVNGKLSELSLQRMKNFSFFTKDLLSFVDHFFVQSQLYKNRFLDLAVDEKKIEICGNLKLDISYPSFDEQSLIEFGNLLGLKGKVLVIASTHEGEEEPILKAVMNSDCSKIILAPRHPQRAKAVRDLLAKLSLSFVSYSEIENKSAREKVILIDQIGLLNKCFALCDLAIVAGSFSQKVGGHNILEPAAYAVPVLFGPHMHKQKDFLSLCSESEFGRQVEIKDLGSQVQMLLSDEFLSSKMGQNGLDVIEKSKGASLKTFQKIQNLFRPKLQDLVFRSS